MSRPISRIPAILKIVAEAWIKNPDLRLGQLLEIAGIDWNTEDLTSLVSQFHNTYNTTPVLWGTYGINGDEPLHYLQLNDMKTEHIKAVVRTQSKISPEVKEILISEVIRRSSN